MAGPSRSPADPLDLLGALQREPYRFGFYEALRRLECLHPDKPRLGTSVRPADDPVRLRQEPSLAFAPATLARFDPGGGGVPHVLSVYCLGLFGPNGPLPLHLTEYARDRQRNHDDPTFVRFMDVFHHRILSLFYRAWAEAQPAVGFDRPDDDRFCQRMASLVGMGMKALRHRDALPDLARFHFAGHLVCQTRNAEGLAQMLSGFFDVPTELEQFVGQWVDLPPSSYLRLGASTATCALGQTTTIGARVWDRQQKFRVAFGPLTMKQYDRLLPGSPSLNRLVGMVRGYVGDELVWDVKLILKKEEVPPLVLGRQGRLGLTTWLLGEDSAEDRSDLMLNPLAWVSGAAADVPGSGREQPRE
jgi:type VI secretion system protein ImpH